MLYTSLDSHEKGENSSSSSPPGFFETYKKPLVFLVSVASIVGIICIIIFVLIDHTGSPDDSVEKYPFTLDSIFNSSLSPKTVNLKWEATGASYLYQDKGTRDWYRHNLATNQSTLVVNVTELSGAIPGYSSFTFSPDGTYLLVSFNVSAVWRHSFLASYKIYNVNTKALHSLVAGDPQLQNVVWNPVSYQVAYVQNYNIYVVDASNPAAVPVAVTTDGDFEDGILNGIQSWVYEEEIFSDYSAVWWSADGTLLAYLRFDESEVPIFEYPVYTGSAYPTQIPLRYPKAGYTNPSVRLYVYDSVNGTSLGFPYLEYGVGGLWEYIASVQWKSDGTLWVQQLNRYQNVTSVQVLSRQNNVWNNQQALERTTNKWIDIFPLYFYGTYNLAIIPNGNFYHIANLQVGSTPTFLTSGNFDVAQIYGFAADGKLYYLSTPPVVVTDPVAATLQHVYTYNPANGNTAQVGGGRGVYTASFSPSGEFYVYTYLGPEVPQVFLVATNQTVNITLEDNKAHTEIISHYDLPTKKFTTVKGEAGDVLNAYYKTPYGSPSNKPLIIDVYAGPGTQKVRQTYDVVGLDAWLAAQGYVVASIDGRGTGRRGLEFLQQTYRQLGLLEIADQRAGAKELADKFDDLINSDRVAIWGWSYGGFMAAHGIAGTSEISDFKFKAGVSVAPVSNWIFYDTVYTERYMSTPADNPNGYNETSVLGHAKNTPANSLLLMHGTGDDNVHFQNTVELANALITGNVQFETMFFPNDNHAINSGNARKYLYEKMTAFLKEAL